MTKEQVKIAEHWQYTGDVNVEHGGYYYRLDNAEWGYAEFVRICPVSDAGGADNQYWIERGTINLPEKRKDVELCLNCIGMLDEYDSILCSAESRLLLLTDATMSYGRYDIDNTTNVQVGADTDCHYRGDGPIGIDIYLGCDDDLDSYVRSQFLQN